MQYKPICQIMVYGFDMAWLDMLHLKFYPLQIASLA